MIRNSLFVIQYSLFNGQALSPLSQLEVLPTVIFAQFPIPAAVSLPAFPASLVDPVPVSCACS
jgi:hypothetical protein